MKSQSIPANLHGTVQKDKAKTQRPDCKPDGIQAGQGEVWNKTYIGAEKPLGNQGLSWKRWN